MANLWMFNDGTYKHRGVWHAVDEVHHQYVPQNRRESQQPIRKYHTGSCELVYHSANGRVWDNGTYRMVVCSCSLHTTEPFVVVGGYKSVRITPEHTIKTAKAICGQVNMRDSGETFNYVADRKVENGVTVTETQIMKKPFIYEGELPPGPVCSRCVKKRAKQNAAS